MRFREGYYFLSNMYPCDITIFGCTFSCAEAAFQAAKCANTNDMQKFIGINGYEAKKLGRRVALRRNWENEKVAVMRQVVTAKFDQHPSLRAALACIPGEICEDNYWHDTFWGKCNGNGLNHLGRILMQIRDDILSKQTKEE